jgi:hypothetical protein
MGYLDKTKLEVISGALNSSSHADHDMPLSMLHESNQSNLIIKLAYLNQGINVIMQGYLWMSGMYRIKPLVSTIDAYV